MMLKFNLKSILEEKDISISQLAKDTDISRPSISAIYNNTSKSVNIDFLDRIMKYLEVSLSELVIEEENIIAVHFYKTRTDNLPSCTLEIIESDNNMVLENISLIPEQFYFEVLNNLYEIAKMDKKAKKANDDILYLFSEVDSMFDHNEMQKFIDSSKALANFLKRIGSHNAYRLISRLLVEAFDFESTNKNEQEFIVIRTLNSEDVFLYTVEGHTILPLLPETKRKKEFPSIKIINESLT
ncbi:MULTISPECIES: helix-turn-helix domain-containing protein [Enterococcus]|uniref:Helix-turn-helix transcriptional regulator n=1 Tax=Enterococcus raffinosus TaxID=71452 RepID=A0AAW8TDW2_9ENTE|nr:MULTISPECIES: helix-turn-helix transcriptional regulator [Enterococcus]MDT2524933.1 helix-turn-helix transcriptional regulator [Enterococcus raffinosus]MDT2535650.1 helix-turn-helix transcriptional regulator [Enterococcus raffinosus]MDT2546020.1 helix-turn-helix transcriptional regulator [Enterococcus raffinosus]MDT2592317.1 helix-turn-helix transcriptional regulator [Enterococcus raffinosus]NVN76937.1 helix-turn-helix domain-containing protein [Enterococcus avium]